MTRMTGPDCVVMCNLINTYIHQCEWHRMTRMTGPDCVVMCNLINTYIHTVLYAILVCVGRRTSCDSSAFRN